MRIRIPIAFSAVSALALLFATAISIAAQAGASSASLERRMGAFLRAVVEEPRDSVAAYFPKSGDWRYVPSLLKAPRGTPPGGWLFRAEETLRAIGKGGPLCWSFEPSWGDTGPFEGAIVSRVSVTRTGWRRVRGNRFVPPGESARSPAFVEWRREGGEWVVSSIGEQQPYYTPRPSPWERNQARRDRRPLPAAPPEASYGANAAWYVSNEPISFEGMTYVKYGLPRPIGDDEVERIGSLGGVAIFVEAGMNGATEILYVLAGPGQYQPYYAFGSRACH
ncbi:MAG TPA: hypothetical protein VFR81_05030 [Longimicrobium sp.]|nr:hypothetical protein [Longimicrobium sp.]